MKENFNAEILAIAKKLERENKEIIISIIVDLMQLDKMNAVRVEVLLKGKR